MPVTASQNIYAAWDDGVSTYATLEAAPSYGVLEGGRLLITRTLPSSGSLLAGRVTAMSFGGVLGSSGGPVKQASHRFQGALTSSALVLLGKIFTRSLAGSLGSSGTVSRALIRALRLGGSTAPTGNAVLRLLYTYYLSLGGNLRIISQCSICLKRASPPPLILVPPDLAPPLCDCPPKPTSPVLVAVAKPSSPALYGGSECRA